MICIIDGSTFLSFRLKVVLSKDFTLSSLQLFMGTPSWLCNFRSYKFCKKKSSNLIKMKKQTRKGYRSKQKNIVYFVEPILPSQVKAEFRLFYYEGDCRRPSTQEEIKRNFIKILNESKFNDVCQGSEKCRAENVNVTCAMIYFTYGRLKRAPGKMLI